MIKLAFLFLTLSGIFHEDYWKDFFKGNLDRAFIHVHAKQGVPKSSWFKRFQMPYRVENSWARTMKAQIALLKEALKDPETAYFIFCSHNTIPLQSFDYIYDELTGLGKSMFWYEKNPHMDPDKPGLYQAHRVLAPIPHEMQHKNAQWIILTREHAQMMVNDRKLVHMISRYPHDQEHYPSTFLAMANELDQVHKKEGTLVVWHLSKRPPYVFKDLGDLHEYQLLTDAIKYGTYFVRKIDEHCNLAPLDDSLAYRDGYRFAA